MEELKEYSIEEESFNVKKHYFVSRGKEVSLDYFLYTSFEEEQNIRQLGNELPAIPKRFPLALLIESNASIPESERSKELDQILDELFSWYAENHPVLSATAILDYDLHAKFIYPFVYMLADLYLLYELKIGKRLPRMDLSSPLEPFWEELSAKLKKYFTSYAHLMWSYLKWCYQTPKQKKLDLASIPPVGRYAAILRKSRSTSGSKDFSSIKDSKKPRKDDHSSQQVEEKSALTEVESAVKKMLDDAQLEQITLKPQNSFIRRKQHKKIISLGFASTSVGEGQERAVQILRSPSLSSDSNSEQSSIED